MSHAAIGHAVLGFVLGFWFAVLVCSLLYAAARDWNVYPR
jgi:hypothetical protein